MTTQILEGLFESKIRIKLLRFLFRNFPEAAPVKAIARHVQATPREVKKELNRLTQIGLVRARLLRRTAPQGRIPLS